jgi:hypothetical protein
VASSDEAGKVVTNDTGDADGGYADEDNLDGDNPEGDQFDGDHLIEPSLLSSHFLGVPHSSNCEAISIHDHYLDSKVSALSIHQFFRCSWLGFFQGNIIFLIKILASRYRFLMYRDKRPLDNSFSTEKLETRGVISNFETMTLYLVPPKLTTSTHCIVTKRGRPPGTGHNRYTVRDNARF